MALDPQIAAILQTLQGQPGMETMPLAQLRSSMLVVPTEKRTPVREAMDLILPASASHGLVPVDLPLRLYRPQVMRRKGLTVFFHGGGFVIGSLETHDHVCRDLCEASGAAVLSVDYRLAPEHKFPAASDDCLAAVRWAAQEAASWGLDASRLVLAGDSAGATLAAVTALRLRDESGPRVLAQVLVYPVTDFHTPATPSYLANAEGYSLTRAAMIRFWTDYLQDEGQASHPHASPLRAPDLSGLPPALVQIAEYDPLHDEGQRYAHRLLDAGVPVTLWRQQGLIHGYFRLALASTRARTELIRTGEWIADAMA